MMSRFQLLLSISTCAATTGAGGPGGHHDTIAVMAATHPPTRTARPLPLPVPPWLTTAAILRARDGGIGGLARGGGGLRAADYYIATAAAAAAAIPITAAAAAAVIPNTAAAAAIPITAAATVAFAAATDTDIITAANIATFAAGAPSSLLGLSWATINFAVAAAERSAREAAVANTRAQWLEGDPEVLQGKALRVDPMKPKLKLPRRAKRMKLNYEMTIKDKPTFDHMSTQDV